MNNHPVSSSRLKVVLALRDPAMCQQLSSLLSEHGHVLAAATSRGPDMERAVLAHEPDVVVFDVRLPGINGLEALRHIYQEQQPAAVALAEASDQDSVCACLADYWLAYLLKPFELHQVEAALRVAHARATTSRQLQEAKAALQLDLQNRKAIERAKGVLMKRYRWSEHEAYQRLQRNAMNQRVSMKHIAEAVLNGTDEHMWRVNGARPEQLAAHV